MPLPDAAGEDPAYLATQLITYLGNKRALLGQVGAAVETVKRRLGKERLRILDAFAGSGVVSRFFKAHAALLVANDFEAYAAVIAHCYLRNRSSVDWPWLRAQVATFNERVDDAALPMGFIEALYAPGDERQITAGDRAFYTRQNARRLDNYRRLLDDVPVDERPMLLGPLLSAASIHANTAGVFKGFYKDRQTKVGQFGGSHSTALNRITGPIRLDVPVLSRFECPVEVFQQDANTLVHERRGFDLAYFDPPYNQHPYGSNYFMLNLLVDYREPTQTSRVSGIPIDWRRSGYNVRARSLPLLRELVHAVDAPFILVSFNDDGFIRPEAIRSLLAEVGSVAVIETRYNTFRGSRNLRNRDKHVTEQLFLVERPH